MMQAHWDRRKSGEGGFTLVELLVVIAILGILAAIVTFAVAGITDKGDESACESDVKTVVVAVEAFAAQSPTNAYPASRDELNNSDLLRGGVPDHVVYIGGNEVSSPDCPGA